MILGVLSDTHGKERHARRGIEVLQQAGAKAFVHCGDVGSESVFSALAGLECWFVWGNTDTATTGLMRYVQQLGIPLPDAAPLTLTLAGRRIAVCHGHERGFEQLVRQHYAAEPVPDDQRFDYLLHGHSHVAARETLPTGLVRVNPGALHRADPYTVATVDLAGGTVRFWVVEPQGETDLQGYDPTTGNRIRL